MAERKRWQTVAFWLLASAGVLLVAGAFAFWMVPTMPPAPELDGISVADPAPTHPQNRELWQLLRGPPQRIDKPLRDAERQVDEDAWPHHPGKLLASMGQQTGAFVAAMQKPGCIEVPVPEFPVLSFSEHVRAAALASVAEVQVGQGDRAATELAALLEALHRLEHQCTPDLPLARMLLSFESRIHRAAGFVLADPTVTPAAADTLSKALVQIETTPCPLAGAIRRQRDEDRDTVRRLPELAKNADFQRVVDRGYKRLLWLAEQPARSAVFSRPSPEQIYARNVAVWPDWLTSLRLGEGTIGGLALIQARLSMGKLEIDSSRFDRCRMAARRAHWLDALRRRHRAVPPALARPAPRNAFTGTAIERTSPRSAFCRRDPLAVPVPAWKGPDDLPPPPTAVTK